MEKRAIVAFILIFIVIFISNELIWKPSIPPKQVSDSLQVVVDSNKIATTPNDTTSFSPTTFLPPDTIKTTIAPTTVPEREIIVDTELYQAVFSTKHANLISWRLKNYTDNRLDDDLPVEDRWLELIPQESNGSLQLDFLEIGVLSPRELEDLLSQNWYYEHEDSLIVVDTDSVTLDFFLRKSNMEIKKSFTFYPSKYAFDLSIEVNGIPSDEIGDCIIRWDSGLNTTEKNIKDDLRFFEGMTNIHNHIKKKKLKKIQKEGVMVLGDRQSGVDEIIWAGTKTKYFTAVIISEQPAIETRFMGAPDDSKIRFSLVRPYLFGYDDDGCHYRVYVGPIDYDRLKAEGHRLESLLDIGKYIGFISRPMLELFIFMHQFIPNYGLVIILFSLFTKLLFYPFNKSSYTSMRKMQELQPKMKEMQEKYKNNPQQLQKEMMELYKEYGVNPLSGCLPMLPQIPIFFALFRVLSATIELRSAGFIPHWIEDLSQPDPFYILPVLMGVTMFIQQKTTPQSAMAANPQQKMFTYVLPVVMTFFFLQFQAGLVLYWFTNNLFTVMQQFFIHRSLKT